MKKLFNVKMYISVVILLTSLTSGVFAESIFQETGCVECHKETGYAAKGEPRTIAELNQAFQGMSYEAAKQKLNNNDIEEHQQANVSKLLMNDSILDYLIARPVK